MNIATRSLNTASRPGYASLKRLFFDKQRVKDSLSPKRLEYLSKLGGRIRKHARNSMKRKGAARKRPKNLKGKAFQKWIDEKINRPAAPAGSPPYMHSGDENASLKKILFAYDGKFSAVVGPVLLNGSRHKGAPATAIQEHGGRVVVREKREFGTKGRWVIASGRIPQGAQQRSRAVGVEPRPFMSPAAIAQKDKLKDMLRQSVAA